MDKEVEVMIEIITAFITAGALVYAGWQLKERTRTRQVALLPKLIEQNTSKEVVEARGLLADAYREDKQQFTFKTREEMEQKLPMGSDLRKACDAVIYSISDFGTFINQGLIEPEFAKAWLHLIPVRMWIILRDYVVIEQERRGYGYYVSPFMHLAKLGIDRWFESPKLHFYEETGEWFFTIFHSADKSLDCKIHSSELDTMRKDLYDKLRKSGWLIRNRSL